MRRAKKGRSLVYLIRADNNLYKIGQSVYPEERFRKLQLVNACTIELLWTKEVEEGTALEAALHRFFDEKRHHGEWFALSESNVSLILNLNDEIIEMLLIV